MRERERAREVVRKCERMTESESERAREVVRECEREIECESVCVCVCVPRSLAKDSWMLADCIT